MIRLSIIIPAYNESQRLPDTLAKVQAFVQSQPYEIEVLVIDDGSKDNTVELAKEWEARFPQLQVVQNKKNKGKGGVVKQGMLIAQGEYRLFMDADSSTPVEEAANLLRFTPEYPVVIGSRHLDPASIKVKQPLKRRVISRVCNWIIQQAVLPGIRDTQCGFKLFSAEAAEKIFPLQSMNGWSFDVEILTIALKLGYAIKETPVEWRDAKNSKLRASRDALRFLQDLIQIYRKYRRFNAAAYR